MLGAFSSQAQNLILLAEDEARMLGATVVEPEHLLLALTRHGNVRSLLAACQVSGSDIHAAIIRSSPVGDALALGRIPRSGATDEALARAVDLAAERGVLEPSSEHLLLAIGQEARVAGILREVGIGDPVELVDGLPGTRRPPVTAERLKRHLLRVAGAWSPPRPGPVPPVFERYTAPAQQATRAAVELASLLEHAYVEPLHLLLGCLHVPASLAAHVLEAEVVPSDMGTRGEAMELARMYGPNPAHQATGIFSDRARQIVARDALSYAYRHGHPSIGTGHVLLATLDADDRAIERIVGSGPMGSGPVDDRLARAVIRALPGEERATGRVEPGGAIVFDQLIRILTDWFRAHLPPGWVIHGDARSCGFRLRVPDSRSEEDFAIDMSWVVTSGQPGRRRLLEVTQGALADMQSAVAGTTATPWPAPGPVGEPPEPHAEITGDAVNPRLRLWYGPSDFPVLELAPSPLVNMILTGRA